jgi:transposase
MGPLSADLRTRVVGAVRGEGMSCRAAAKRFGVSFASAIRWVAALRERGSCAPLPMGGDTRSRRVEAHADYLLGLNRREPDLTLVEICDRLERVRGEKVSPSMIWRFFDRRGITYKKVGARQRTGPPRRPPATLGMVRRSTRPRSAEARFRR